MSNGARNWLNGPRDYLEGITLLESTGAAGSSLIKLLKSGETVFTRKKLVQQIKELAAQAEIDNLPIEPIERSKMIVPYDPLQLPQELKDVHLLKGQLYKKAGELRQILFTLKTAKERAPICLEITRIRKQHAQLWDQLNYYQNTGTVMPKHTTEEVEPDLENMTVRQLVDFIRNNPTRISKWRKALKTETDKNERINLHGKMDKHKLLQEEANRIIDEMD